MNSVIKVLPGFCFCLWLMSCTAKQPESSTETGPMRVVAAERNFEDFFNQFGTDSIFQEERVKYPLPYFFYEEYADTMSINEMNMGDWRYINFANDSLARTRKTDAYDVTVDQQDSISVDYTRSGIDNGIFVTYSFRREGGRWYLVKIEDRSN